MLYSSYPRLTRPPLNLQTDELLGAVVERLLKAMRKVRPRTVREFFALANQHMRWELNDLARRLDEQPADVELREGLVPAPASSDSALTPDARRILEAIDGLPEDEREAFNLVRIQGLTQAEAAEVLGVSTKTVQRRLNRGPAVLAERLDDLRPTGSRRARRRPGQPGRVMSAWDRDGRGGPAMTGEPDVRRLLEEILDSGLTPEEVCQGDPELLPQVRERLRHLRRVEAQLDALFPPASPPDAGSAPPGRRSPNRLSSPVTRCRACWAAAAWASCTGRGIVA